MLKRAFENTKENNLKKYEETKETFDKFIASAKKIDYKKLEDLASKYYEAKKAKKKAIRTLTHKSNRENIEKQISDIKTGRKNTQIENQIQKDIFRTFKKMDHLSNIVDKRSLQEMFMSIMTTQLIVDYKTDKQVKRDLIRNHTDKIGLFDHVWRIYEENTQMFLEIET